MYILYVYNTGSIDNFLSVISDDTQQAHSVLHSNKVILMCSYEGVDIVLIIYALVDAS